MQPALLVDELRARFETDLRSDPREPRGRARPFFFCFPTVPRSVPTSGLKAAKEASHHRPFSTAAPAGFALAIFPPAKFGQE